VAVDERLLEESAQELFDGAPCGYLAMLPDGTIVKVNETFLTWTGYTRETLLAGATFRELLTVPGRIYYDTHIGPLLQLQGFVREVAFDLLRPEGPALSVVLNCTQKRDADGTGLLIKITVFDATDRRQYERELLVARRAAERAAQTERLAREAAERANRTKDDFLALVTHELRTPLSAILGWTQVLQKRAAGNVEVEHGLTIIERNTRLQARLIDDLLDMSRIDSGKMRLDVQRVDLADVIEAALETAAPAALARNIRLQKVLDPAIVVSGDPGRLQQVFWNLFSNSVKFTPKGGVVRVVMERINSHVEVSVIDSGQGMTREMIAHAFERFRQSTSASTRETGGLGLGLSLVKHLVEMHGGSIEARSEGEGRGTTFVLKLPVVVVQLADTEVRFHPQAAVSTGAVGHMAVTLTGLRVVVADDDRDARELLWHVLTASGAEVVSAASAGEALEAVERVRPHVLVSDIGMPGEDGYELIRKVRMLGENVGRVPAVALTALSRLEDRTRALLSGYQIHLAKPVDARELVVTVASLASRIDVSPRERE
jgi:PAS domain S-box-containing protein